MLYLLWADIYISETSVRALELPSFLAGAAVHCGPLRLINESQEGSSRDPAPMAASPGAWQRQRETGESRRTCHTPKFQNREIFRQSGVGTFPWNVEMLPLFCNVSENRIVELFRSHGATYRAELRSENQSSGMSPNSISLSFYLTNVIF